MNTTKPVAWVTGGGAGIGRASALRFAREGWRVLLSDLAEDDGRKVQAEIKAAGGEAAFVPGDVSKEADNQKAAAEALKLWGRLDAVLANAGARVYGDLLAASEADWEKIIGVNLKGVAYACKAALPAMKKQKSGSLVVISSANALVGRGGMPLYDATKAAVLSLVRSLAVAHGPEGIRANAICPGFTMTDFHARSAAKSGKTLDDVRASQKGYALLGRPVEPSEIAAAVYFLASPESAMITGQTLFVDAGLSVGAAGAK